MTHYAIIGFGCAGYYAAKSIRQLDKNGEIHIYSNHGTSPYNPMLTTYYTSDRISWDGLHPFGELLQIQEELSATIFTDTEVKKVDGVNKAVCLEDGSERKYDKILVCTGASAFIPPIEGVNDPRVFSMRTQKDAMDLKSYIEHTKLESALVVGASMTGIKVAELLHNRGIKTTITDIASHQFPLAAYEEFGKLIEEKLKKKGLAFRLKSTISSIQAEEEYLNIIFDEGEPIKTDLIVMCIGTRTNSTILDDSQFVINKGVVVDEHMETSVQGIYAAGDCCEGKNIQSNENQIIGLWAAAGRQGTVAGINMAGGDKVYQGNILHNITHFMDIDFIGIGDNQAKGEDVFFGTPESDLYIKAVISDHKLAGVNILGNARISGIIKYYFINVLQGRMNEITPLQRGLLRKEGITNRFMDLMEGKNG